MSLENILDKIKAGEVKEVKVVLKADVQGSVEAIANALTKLSTDKVGVNVISTGVGGITESDVSLAKASSAIVVGFNVRPAGKAQQLAEQEGVDIKLYQVIYDAIDDVKKAMVGMLAPITREKLMGKAEVRQVFTIPKAGTIAGCFVTEGKITRKAQLRLVRDSVVIYTGKVGSLRRFKDDVSEVAQGYECGLSIEGYGDLKEGDIIEAFEIETIAATLDEPDGRQQARCASGGRLERRSRVTVGIARVTLFLGESHSLKEKRMVLRRMKDLVRNKFNVSIAEVAENDLWQRAVLGLTLVGSDRRFAESALDEVLRFIRGHVQVSNEEQELQIFGDELAGPDFKHWEE